MIRVTPGVYYDFQYRIIVEPLSLYPETYLLDLEDYLKSSILYGTHLPPNGVSVSQYVSYWEYLKNRHIPDPNSVSLLYNAIIQMYSNLASSPNLGNIYLLPTWKNISSHIVAYSSLSKEPAREQLDVKNYLNKFLLFPAKHLEYLQVLKNLSETHQLLEVSSNDIKGS